MWLKVSQNVPCKLVSMQRAYFWSRCWLLFFVFASPRFHHIFLPSLLVLRFLVERLASNAENLGFFLDIVQLHCFYRREKESMKSRTHTERTHAQRGLQRHTWRWTLAFGHCEFWHYSMQWYFEDSLEKSGISPASCAGQELTGRKYEPEAHGRSRQATESALIKRIAYNLWKNI